MADHLSAIKTAFDLGYKAFQEVVANDKGIYNNPVNTYKKDTLLYKEFERGYSWAYYEQKKKTGAV